MPRMLHAINRLRTLDALSRGNSPLHRLHPAAKLVVTVVFAATAMSFGRHEVAGLVPLALYPVLVWALSDIPLASVLAPLLLLEPFVLSIGLLNPLLDGEPVTVGGMTFARGWLAFLSIAVKATLTLLSAILLAATTGADAFAAGLRSLAIPRVFVLQLLLTYRYIWLLLEEAARALTAHSLRAPGGGVRRGAWGGLAGGLLLRTHDRAERVGHAMALRGYDGEYRAGPPLRAGIADYAFVLAWLCFFALARFVDVAGLLGTFAMETAGG